MRVSWPADRTLVRSRTGLNDAECMGRRHQLSAYDRGAQWSRSRGPGRPDRITTEEEIDRTEPAGDDESEESELGYGWDQARDPKIGNYSLSDIVTSPKVKIRTDGRSVSAAASWASIRSR